MEVRNCDYSQIALEGKMLSFPHLCLSPLFLSSADSLPPPGDAHGPEMEPPSLLRESPVFLTPPTNKDALKPLQPYSKFFSGEIYENSLGQVSTPRLLLPMIFQEALLPGMPHVIPYFDVLPTRLQKCTYKSILIHQYQLKL